MSKPLVNGVHILPSGAELTIAGGEPVSVLFRGADVEQTQEEIEAFTELWIEDMDDSDDNAPAPTKIWIDPDQPTHFYTDAKGSRRVVLREGAFNNSPSDKGSATEGFFTGDVTHCTEAKDRYEDWGPGLLDGKWYNTWTGDVIEGATLVSLTPEIEA